MKRTSNRLSYILCLLLAGAGLTTMGCNRDEEQIKEEIVEIDRDTVTTTQNDMTIVFQLLNKNHQAVKTFKEGENIIFRLVITNNRNEERSLPAFGIVASREIFKVYTSSGVDKGLPWDYMTNGIWNVWTHFAPKASIEVIAPWLDDGTETKIFAKETPRQPLAKGNYYTEFELTLDDNVKVKLHKDFTIK